MGTPISLVPFWVSLLLALSISAGGPHLGAKAQGPLGGAHEGPPGEAPVEIAYEVATASKEDALKPSRADQGHHWCRALDLHSAYGACSSSNGSSDSSSVFPVSLDDGCFGVVLLLLLLLAADQAERPLRKFWGPLSSLAKRMRRSSSSNSNGNNINRFAVAARTEEGKRLLGELASLQQLLLQEQMQQKELSATEEFAAYARKQRKIDQLVSSRDACMQKLQQLQQQQGPQQQRSRKEVLLLLRAANQLLLKPLFKRHGCAVAKPFVCWGLFAAMGARIILPTAQLTPLNLLGPHCQVTFPFAFMICRLFLNEMYRHVDFLSGQSSARSTAKAD